MTDLPTGAEKRGVMKLARTSDFYYIGFQPPLSDKRFENFPRPTSNFDGKEHACQPTSNEPFPHNDSMDVGFDGEVFLYRDEAFLEYSMQLAEHLGDYCLDKTVRIIGSCSVIDQAEGEPAQL